jgi:hypothetical protein
MSAIRWLHTPSTLRGLQQQLGRQIGYLMLCSTGWVLVLTAKPQYCHGQEIPLTTRLDRLSLHPVLVWPRKSR